MALRTKSRHGPSAQSEFNGPYGWGLFRSNRTSPIAACELVGVIPESLAIHEAAAVLIAISADFMRITALLEQKNIPYYGPPAPANR